MSVARKISVVYDIDTVEKVAKSLGYTTKRNAGVRGYANRVMENNIDLVVQGTDCYDLGFKVLSDGKTELVADFHGSSAHLKMERIVPAYLEHKMKGKFRMQKRVDTADKINLFARR